MQTIGSHLRGRQVSRQGNVPTQQKQYMWRRRSGYTDASPMSMATVVTAMFFINHSLTNQIEELREESNCRDNEKAELIRALAELKKRESIAVTALSSCESALKEKTAELHAVKALLTIKDAELAARSARSSPRASCELSCDASCDDVDAMAVIHVAQPASMATVDKGCEGASALTSSSSPSVVPSPATSRRCSSSCYSSQAPVPAADTLSVAPEGQPPATTPSKAPHELLVPGPELMPVPAAVMSSKVWASESTGTSRLKNFMRHTKKGLRRCSRQVKDLWAQGPSFLGCFHLSEQAAM